MLRPQPRVSTANPDPRFASHLREFVSLRQPWLVASLFAILIAAQAVGFLTLGTGRGGLRAGSVAPRPGQSCCPRLRLDRFPPRARRYRNFLVSVCSDPLDLDSSD